MWCWQWICFHIQRTNLVKIPSIQPNAVIEDHIADNFPLQSLIIFLSKFLIIIRILQHQSLQSILLSTASNASLLSCLPAARLGNLINFIFCKCNNFLFEFFICWRFLIISFSFDTNFCPQFFLCLDLYANGIMCQFQGFHQIFFTAFLASPSTIIRFFSVAAIMNSRSAFSNSSTGWIHNQSSINPGNTHFTDNFLDGNIRNSQCCGGCQAGQCIRHYFLITRNQGDQYLHIAQIIFRKQRTQCTVN